MRESFTPYGNRRDAADWMGPPSSSNRTTMDGITRQGYPFQTVVGSMGLNHMKGRVQDAITGSFLSTDPFVTALGYTQNFNRYAYTYNNPLTFTDPTGFTVKSEDCGREGSQCQPTPEEIEEIIVSGCRYCASFYGTMYLQGGLPLPVLPLAQLLLPNAAAGVSDGDLQEIVSEAPRCWNGEDGGLSDLVDGMVRASTSYIKWD